MTTRTTPVLCFAWVTLAALSLHAQPAPTPTPPTTPEAQASAWIDEGIARRAERRDEEALALFRRAFEATHSPEAQAQIALAEQALGRWVDAEHDLLAAAAGDHPWIVRHRADLDFALSEVRSHLGSLTLRATTPRATATINGRDVGAVQNSPPLRVVVGTALVEVQAEGFVAARRSVEVRAGDDLLEEFALVAERPVVQDPPPQQPRRQPSAPQGPSSARAWGVGLLVGAGALAVGATITWILRETAAVSFNRANCMMDSATGVAFNGPNCAGLQSETSTYGALTIAGFATAGALAAGGVVLYLTGAPSPRRAWRCAPGVGSLACAVQF